MSRKWFTMLFIAAAAACGGAEDDADLELEEGLETEETLPATPVQPMDTMSMDTMMMDTAADTMSM